MTCNSTFILESYSHGEIKLNTSSVRNMYCVIRLYAKDVKFLLRLTFNSTIGSNNTEINQCGDYIHVGNNMDAVDGESLTSLKLCGQCTEDANTKCEKVEVVSRGPTLWLVLRFQKWNSETNHLAINYEVLPQGTINFNEWH